MEQMWNEEEMAWNWGQYCEEGASGSISIKAVVVWQKTTILLKGSALLGKS